MELAASCPTAPVVGSFQDGIRTVKDGALWVEAALGAGHTS
jgi:hypothetical protein